MSVRTSARRPSDVRQTSVGRVLDVRPTSVGRLTDVRRMSVGRGCGEIFGILKEMRDYIDVIYMALNIIPYLFQLIVSPPFYLTSPLKENNWYLF